MSNLGRKAAIAAVAFATVGSTLFGGVALAHDKKDDGKHDKKDVKVTQDTLADASGKGIGGDCKNNWGWAWSVKGDASSPVCSYNGIGGTATATNLLGG